MPNRRVVERTIDALDIKVEVAPGATGEVTINAPTGTYEYICAVPGHAQLGMIGTLTVRSRQRGGPQPRKRGGVPLVGSPNQPSQPLDLRPSLILGV